MEKLIYVVYPLLLVLLFWGSKLYGRKEFNEDAFSLGQMKAMQGFAALMIMLHHIGQKTCASWLDPRKIKPGLEFFVPIGYVLVSVFIFCSGYGLYKSYKSKENYLSGNFIAKRILPIIITGYVIALVFLAVRLLVVHENPDKMQLIWYITGLKLANPNGWYVIVMPFFYLCFFLAFKYIKKESIAILAVFLFTLAYQLFGSSLDHYDWWVRGEWWYNSVHLFVIGIFFAKHEEGILKHIKKFYPLYLILCIIAAVVFWFLQGYTKEVFSYYAEYWNAPDKVFRRRVCLLAEVFASASIVFLAFLIGLKLKIGNKVLAFMGKITLEFYLIHGVFVELFAEKFDSEFRSLYEIKNPFFYVLAVLIPSLPAAVLINKLMHIKRKGN